MNSRRARNVLLKYHIPMYEYSLFDSTEPYKRMVYHRKSINIHILRYRGKVIKIELKDK